VSNEQKLVANSTRTLKRKETEASEEEFDPFHTLKSKLPTVDKSRFRQDKISPSKFKLKANKKKGNLPTEPSQMRDYSHLHER
jgi:hypothetical protein